MANKKNNRSVQRTERAVEGALVELAREMPFRKITVSAIVARSGVSRGTFYLHYHDVYDLLGKMGDRVLDEVDARLGEVESPEGSGDTVDFTRALLEAVFDTVEANRDVVRLYLREDGNALAFKRRLGELRKKHLPPVAARRYAALPAHTQELYFAFTTDGLLRVVTDWLENDCAPDRRELSDEVGLILLGSVQALAAGTPGTGTAVPHEG